MSQHEFLLDTAARGCSNVRPAGLMASQCRGDHGESPVAGLLYLRRFLLEELGGLARLGWFGVLVPSGVSLGRIRSSVLVGIEHVFTH